MNTRDESGYRHLMRVRFGGVHGPKGKLLHIEKKDKSGWYWKVKLDTGEWVWPVDLMQDGIGDHVGTCAECRMRFMTKAPEPLCPRCDEEMFGTQRRATESRFDGQPVRWKHEDRGRGFHR